MKKTIFALALLALATAPVCAQDDEEKDYSMQFVDAEGNIVPDGSIINRTEVEEDPLGEEFGQISSGLYAKNTTDHIVNIDFYVEIEEIPSGTFQHCFPGNCVTRTEPCIIEKNVGAPGTTIEAGTTNDLQSEWILEEGSYGTCVVSYQFVIYEADKITYDFNYLGDGPRITVNYIYADPSGVDVNVADKMLRSITYYDLSGREVSNPAGGVYVKKMAYADGTVNTGKVLLK